MEVAHKTIMSSFRAKQQKKTTKRVANDKSIYLHLRADNKRKQEQTQIINSFHTDLPFFLLLRALRKPQADRKLFREAMWDEFTSDVNWFSWLSAGLRGFINPKRQQIELHVRFKRF